MDSVIGGRGRRRADALDRGGARRTRKGIRAKVVDARLSEDGPSGQPRSVLRVTQGEGRASGTPASGWRVRGVGPPLPAPTSHALGDGEQQDVVRARPQPHRGDEPEQEPPLCRFLTDHVGQRGDHHRGDDEFHEDEQPPASDQ